jgi:hypothetical protein
MARKPPTVPLSASGGNSARGPGCGGGAARMDDSDQASEGPRRGGAGSRARSLLWQGFEYRFEYRFKQYVYILLRSYVIVHF